MTFPNTSISIWDIWLEEYRNNHFLLAREGWYLKYRQKYPIAVSQAEYDHLQKSQQDKNLPQSQT